MTNRLPHPRTVTHWANTIAELADLLTPTRLAELRRLHGESPKPLEEGPGAGHHDGYPPGGDHTGRGSDIADPTYTRATAKDVPDPTAEAITALHNELRTIHQAARRALHLHAYATGATNDTRGRISSLQGACACCQRDVAGSATDRIVSGYCRSCYEAWRRNQFPDRSTFERQRRRSLEERREGDAA